MKKVTLIAALLSVTLLGSCVKEYTCSCTQYDTSLKKTVNSWSNTDIMTKEDAEAWCNGEELSGFGLETTCTLR